MKVRQNTQELINKICNGDFNKSDIGMFFITLRGDFKGEPILLDLSNFVAHGDERDQGLSFNYVKSFVNNFISISEIGGTIFGMNPLFQSDKLISLIINKLIGLKFNLDQVKFLSQKEKIINYIQELMDETTIKIDDPRVVRCYIKKFNNTVSFCLNLDLKGPVVIVSPEATISSNFFD